MNDDVHTQVLALLERGSTPKQITKAVRLRPGVVAPLIRQAAEARQAGVNAALRTLLSCWLSRTPARVGTPMGPADRGVDQVGRIISGDYDTSGAEDSSQASG